MAKKQTRRSISVSRTTYERLKAFCESNNISMSQFVETRVGRLPREATAPTTVDRRATPRPSIPPTSRRRSPARPAHADAAPTRPKPDDPRPAHRRAGADDVGRRAVRGRAAPAGDQAEAGAARAQAGREAPGSDLHVLERDSFAGYARGGDQDVAAAISSSERRAVVEGRQQRRQHQLVGTRARGERRPALWRRVVG